MDDFWHIFGGSQRKTEHHGSSIWFLASPSQEVTDVIPFIWHWEPPLCSESKVLSKISQGEDGHFQLQSPAHSLTLGMIKAMKLGSKTLPYGLLLPSSSIIRKP